MKDLFSCKMIGSGICSDLEEQYNAYTIDDDYNRKHDATPSIMKK